MDILRCCEESDIKQLKYLLSIEGTNHLSVMDAKNRGPLHIAAEKGNLQIVEILLSDTRVDVNAVTTTLYTPLSLSAEKGHLQVVKRLLSHPQVDINKSIFSGNTAMTIARYNGHLDIVEEIKKKKRETTSAEHELNWVLSEMRKTNVTMLLPLALAREQLLEPETRSLALKSPLIKELLGLLDRAKGDDVMVILRLISGLSQVEILKKTFLENGAFKMLGKALIKSSNKKPMMNPFFLLLMRSQDIREAVSKCGVELMNALHIYMTETQDGVEKLYCGGIVLILSGYFENHIAVPYAARQVIFPEVEKGNATAVYNLIIASSIETSRAILASYGSGDLLEAYVEGVENDLTYMASLGIALLSGSDPSPLTDSRNKATNPVVIDKIIQGISQFAKEKIQRINIQKDFIVDCKIMLMAMSSLGLNEYNSQVLHAKNVETILVSLLKERRDDFLTSNMETFEQVARCIWSLSFDEKIRETFTSLGIEEVLLSYDIENESKKEMTGILTAREALKGALFILRGDRLSSESGERNVSQGGYILISYSWAQKERMRSLASSLKEKNLKIWIDVEQMAGSVLEKMAEAVENASIVIIGLSPHYKESQACRTEAEYAYKLKKTVIFVMAEDGYHAKGWLGALLGSQLWYNPWTHHLGSIEGVSEFIETVKYRFSSVLPKESISSPPRDRESFMRTRTLSVSQKLASKFPEGLTALDEKDMKKSKALKWSVKDVCRWLKMKGFDFMMEMFINQDIDGEVLFYLSKSNSLDTLMKGVGEDPSIKLGQLIKFNSYVTALFDEKIEISKWTKEETSTWMTSIGQNNKSNWTGETLVMFYRILEKGSFESFQSATKLSQDESVTFATHLCRLLQS